MTRNVRAIRELRASTLTVSASPLCICKGRSGSVMSSQRISNIAVFSLSALKGVRRVRSTETATRLTLALMQRFYKRAGLTALCSASTHKLSRPLLHPRLLANMSTTRQSVIMLGLPASHPTIAAQGIDPETIAQGVKVMTQKLRDEGYDLAVVQCVNIRTCDARFQLIRCHRRLSPETGLDGLQAKLKEQELCVHAPDRTCPVLTAPTQPMRRCRCRHSNDTGVDAFLGGGCQHLEGV